MNLGDRICDALKTEIGHAGWGQPAALFMLYDEGETVRVSQVDDAGVFQREPPAQALAGVISMFCRRPAHDVTGLFPQNLVAAAFRAEMWFLHAVHGTPEAAEAHAAARAGRIHDHPDRVKYLTMWAVTATGACYFASQAEGEDEITAAKTNGQFGDLPESLARFMRHITAGAN